MAKKITLTRVVGGGYRWDNGKDFGDPERVSYTLWRAQGGHHWDIRVFDRGGIRVDRGEAFGLWSYRLARDVIQRIGLDFKYGRDDLYKIVRDAMDADNQGIRVKGNGS